MAIVASDEAVPHYVQLLNMIPKQYVDDLIPKSCKVGDICDEKTLINVLTDGVNVFIKPSLRNYWATYSRANLADIALRVKALLSIQKRSGENPSSNYSNTNPAKLYASKPWIFATLRQT